MLLDFYLQALCLCLQTTRCLTLSIHDASPRHVNNIFHQRNRYWERENRVFVWEKERGKEARWEVSHCWFYFGGRKWAMFLFCVSFWLCKWEKLLGIIERVHTNVYWHWSFVLCRLGKWGGGKTNMAKYISGCLLSNEIRNEKYDFSEN